MCLSIESLDSSPHIWVYIISPSRKCKQTFALKHHHRHQFDKVMKANSSSCTNAVVYTILALILALIVIANGIIVLYACLVWHTNYDNEINARFMVGIIIFVTCTTLPFALITGYLVYNCFCFFHIYLLTKYSYTLYSVINWLDFFPQICSTSQCTFNLQICTCIKRVFSNLKGIVSIHGEGLIVLNIAFTISRI